MIGLHRDNRIFMPVKETCAKIIQFYSIRKNKKI